MIGLKYKEGKVICMHAKKEYGAEEKMKVCGQLHRLATLSTAEDPPVGTGGSSAVDKVDVFE